MKKKIIYIALIVAVLISVFAVSASALVSDYSVISYGEATGEYLPPKYVGYTRVRSVRFSLSGIGTSSGWSKGDYYKELSDFVLTGRPDSSYSSVLFDSISFSIKHDTGVIHFPPISMPIFLYGGMDQFVHTFVNSGLYFRVFSNGDSVGLAMQQGTVPQYSFGNGIDVVVTLYKRPSSSSYQEGYDAGTEYGYEYGYGDGFLAGSNAGYQNGYAVGTEDGYRNGYEVGHFEGLNFGYDEGFATGVTVGTEEGYNKSIAKITELEATNNQLNRDILVYTGKIADLEEDLGNVNALDNLLNGLFSGISNFSSTIFGLGYGGFTIGSIVALAVTATVIIFLIKKFA